MREKLKKIQGVVFDMDGLMFDTVNGLSSMRGMWLGVRWAMEIWAMKICVIPSVLMWCADRNTF